MLPERSAAAEFTLVLVRLRADVPAGVRTQSVAYRRSRLTACARSIRKGTVRVAQSRGFRGLLATCPTRELADRRRGVRRVDVIARLLLSVSLAAGNVTAA